MTYVLQCVSESVIKTSENDSVGIQLKSGRTFCSVLKTRQMY